MKSRILAGIACFALAVAAFPQSAPKFEPDPNWQKLQILNRETLRVVGFFGGSGGHGTGHFYHLHSIVTDSKGNVYVGESFGERVLRVNLKSR
jgi:hypothetical protein